MFALRIAQTCRRRVVWASIPRARTYSVNNSPFDRVEIQRKLEEIPTWNKMRDNSEVMEAVKSAGEVFMNLGTFLCIFLNVIIMIQAFRIHPLAK